MPPDNWRKIDGKGTSKCDVLEWTKSTYIIYLLNFACGFKSLVDIFMQ